MAASALGIKRPTSRPDPSRYPLTLIFAAAVALAFPTLARAAPTVGDRVLPPGLDIRSASALIVDQTGEVLYAKATDEQRPIASITKLMTALVLLDASLPMDQPITIVEADRDTLRNSRSRLRIDRAATLPRRQMLAVALMSSDNRAASALGRTAFPGGKPAFVAAMNRKAADLGMTDSQFADPTGLDANNRSTAADLLKLVQTAAQYPLIREITGRAQITVWPFGNTGEPSAALEYRNTNPLVNSDDWRIEVSKTGYINESGRCLVMRAVTAGRRLDIVLLESWGKRTAVGDSNRVRQWLEAQSPEVIRGPSDPPIDRWTTPYWE